MKNTYEKESMELKASFRKALIFCVAVNAIIGGSLFGELSNEGMYGYVVNIGEILLGLVMYAVMFGWWFSCLGFAVVNYRYTRNPSASIMECLRAKVSEKRISLAYTWKGALNAMEILGRIRDLELMAAAENAESTATATVRAADF